MTFEEYIGKQYLMFSDDDDYDEFSNAFSLLDLEKCWNYKQKEIELYKSLNKALKLGEYTDKQKGLAELTKQSEDLRLYE